MSGIAGIVHLRGEPPDRDLALQLSTGIAHRGTSDKGLFIEGPAALVHRRRKRQNEDPKQPIVTDRYVVCFDGEPTPTFLEDWADHAHGALNATRGPFAMVLWDRQDRVLWLARGPVGAKPLFWSRSGTKLAAASEVGPLLRLPWVSSELELQNLSEYLAFRYVHAPRTLLRDVHAVPPGTLIRLDASGEHTEAWWQPPWPEPGWSLPDARDVATRVDAALRRSVERNLEGGPTGVLLSGGLDSSAILYHASGFGSVPATYTASFQGQAASEDPFAARIANVLGSEHHTIEVDPQPLFDAIGPCTEGMGAPIPGPAALVQHFLFQHVRSEVRVLLSGDGGDEVFAGFGMANIAAGLRVARATGHLPGPLKRVTRRVAHRAGMDNLAASHANFGLDRAIGGSMVFHARDRVGILRDPALVRPDIRLSILEPMYQQVLTDPINAILHVRQVGWLCEDTLARSDRMSNLADVDLRYPVLDREVLEVAAALPGAAKVRRQGLSYITKAPLRDAMLGRLPDRVLNRPKRRFPRPLDRWLRGPGRPMLEERTEAICADPEALFDPVQVRKLAREHRSGMRDHAVKLWTLMFFHAWRQSVSR